MSQEAIPAKTQDGLNELSNRTRGLGQRHRTVLLLVDGRRSRAQVLNMAQAAGVQPSVFEELVELGLVAQHAARPATSAGQAIAHHIDLPLENTMDSSMLPSARSLLPESAWDGLDSVRGEPGHDRPFEEARQLLLRAVRTEAPVAGSLTMLKLRRARTRDQLEALLDEVEQRLRKPQRMIIAAQTMRHVRHLLSLPDGSSRPSLP